MPAGTFSAASSAPSIAAAHDMTLEYGVARRATQAGALFSTGETRWRPTWVTSGRSSVHTTRAADLQGGERQSPAKAPQIQLHSSDQAINAAATQPACTKLHGDAASFPRLMFVN